MGMPADRVVFCEDGDQIVLADDGVEHQGSIGGDHLYVDGMVGDLGNTVLSERRTLGDDGFVTVVVHVDMEHGEIVAGPDVILTWLGRAAALAGHEAAVADAVESDLLAALKDPDNDIERLGQIARRAAGRTVNDRTRRRDDRSGRPRGRTTSLARCSHRRHVPTTRRPQRKRMMGR